MSVSSDLVCVWASILAMASLTCVNHARQCSTAVACASAWAGAIVRPHCGHSAALAPHASHTGANTHGGACHTLTLCDTSSICAANAASMARTIFRIDAAMSGMPNVSTKTNICVRASASNIHTNSSAWLRACTRAAAQVQSREGKVRAQFAGMSQAWHVVLVRA